MPQETVTSKEMALRNLASDITNEIREQIKNQEILNIPLKNYRDENYAGNSGTESIFELDTELDKEVYKDSKDGLMRSMTFGLYKEGIKDVLKNKNRYVELDHISLRIGESPVINPPWQFNELDDVRSNLTYPHMGRVYLTYIYSNFPILTFQPGRERMNANLLTFFTKGLGTDHTVLNKYIRSGGKPGILSGIAICLTSIKNTTLGAIEGALSLMGINFADASKFITFKPAMKLYRELANNFLREFAANLGLLNLTNEKNDVGFNFSVVKDSTFKEAEVNRESEYYKDIQEMNDGDSQFGIDSKNPNMSRNESVVAAGKEIEEERDEIDFFGGIAKIVNTVSGTFENALSRVSTSYRGSIRRLDILDMIPHITYENSYGKISNFFGTIENRSYLPYLCQSNISISETFNNSTKEHPIMSSINSMSESMSDSKGIGGAQSIIDSAKSVLGGESIANKFNDLLMGATKKAVGEIGSNFGEMGAIMNGNGKLLVPEIWASSSYSRSYSVDFKFWSPTGDIVSIFENVYIPYLLLMVLAMPLQTGYHSYVSPFAIKVFSKGLFSVDFGMIESLTVTRGDGSNDRTRTNFPRSIKVSVSIKDLSPTLLLSLGGGKFWKYRRANSSLGEYIATMCNLSLGDRVDIGRKFDTYWALQTANLRDKFSLNNIGFSYGSSFIFKPIMAWNRNKVTVDQVNTTNIYM